MADIRALPLYQLANVPASLRQLANRIEHGDHVSGNVTRCLVLTETDEGVITYHAFGDKDSFSRTEAVGICFAAIQTILPTDFVK